MHHPALFGENSTSSFKVLKDQNYSIEHFLQVSCTENRNLAFHIYPCIKMRFFIYRLSVRLDTAYFAENLGSTDAAPEVPHPRRTRPDAATRRGSRCPRVRPRRATWIPRGFLRLAPTRADSALTRADASRFGPTRA